mmetsp:Transcript_15789/g.38416  ORF Transcript_15789/g.38416 Transcript_15789/m.38416 type:complete len:314 (-) Transcript_15789:3590-4531(-)
MLGELIQLDVDNDVAHLEGAHLEDPDVRAQIQNLVAVQRLAVRAGLDAHVLHHDPAHVEVHVGADAHVVAAQARRGERQVSVKREVRSVARAERGADADGALGVVHDHAGAPDGAHAHLHGSPQLELEHPPKLQVELDVIGVEPEVHLHAARGVLVDGGGELQAVAAHGALEQAPVAEGAVDGVRHGVVGVGAVLAPVNLGVQAAVAAAAAAAVRDDAGVVEGLRAVDGGVAPLAGKHEETLHPVLVDPAVGDLRRDVQLLEVASVKDGGASDGQTWALGPRVLRRAGHLLALVLRGVRTRHAACGVPLAAAA